MLCQECGNPLNEGDKACKTCGSPVRDDAGATNIEIGAEIQTDGSSIMISSGVPKNESDTIKDASVPSKFDGDKIDIEQDNLNWDLNGFPKPKKTEDIDFDWNIDEKTFGRRITAEDKKSSKNLTDNIHHDHEIDSFNSNLTDELNKFFNFEKSNEDFQKLLDKEYESIQERPSPQQNQVNVRRINLVDRMNLTGDISIPTILSGVEGASPNTAGTPSGQAESNPQKVGQENDYQEEEAIPAHDTIIEAARIEDETEAEEEPTVIWVDAEGDSARNLDIDAGNSSVHDLDIDVEKAQIHNLDIDAERASIHSADIAGDEATEQDEVDEETKKTLAGKDGDIPAALWFETDDKEQDSKKKFNIGRAVLILIIAVLLAEATILGIQYFLPNTGAARKAEQINGSISGALNVAKDRTVELFRGIAGKGDADQVGTNDPDQSVDEEGDDSLDKEVGPGEDADPVDEPDTAPSKDKDALIAAVIAEYGSNITEVETNDKLAWKQGKGYAIPDIKDSEPIDNNYWYTTPKGEHVYYDKEIIATLIQFDSQWVDYVNGGSKLVIELTKEESKARKNAETFSKVGKVKQTFNLLEIGEIRQSKEAFYAWTYEEIKEVQGNKTTVKKYNWIYRLEPVDKEMKIVNYYTY